MIKHRLVYWVVGVIVAFTGVAMVRILSFQVPEEKTLLTLLGGFTLSILGLFIITLGTRRKSTD